MNRPFLTALLLTGSLLTLAGCQTGGTISITPPAELAGTPRLAVAGRQGWLPSGALRYGEFSTQGFKADTTSQRTERCRHGCWSVSLSRDNAVRFETAFQQSKRRLVFRQLDGRGTSADVRALADWQVDSEQWTRPWFNSALSSTRSERLLTVFGTIVPNTPDTPAWRFWFAQDESTEADSIGLAQDDEGRRIDIRAWTDSPLPPAAGWLSQLPVAGYVLVADGQAVAAVDTLAGGHVWIADRLPPALRLVAAGLCSTLLLREQFAPAPRPLGP